MLPYEFLTEEQAEQYIEIRDDLRLFLDKTMDSFQSNFPELSPEELGAVRKHLVETL